MKKAFIFIFLMLLNLSIFAQLELRFKLLTSTNKFVYCEPILAELSWKNIGKTAIKIGHVKDPFHSSATKIIINGEEVDKYPAWTVVSLPGLIDPLASDVLKRDEEMKSDIDLSTYKLGPGHYNVKFIADFTNVKGEGYYKGRLESDEIEFRIEAPVGEDLMALNWSREEYKKAKNKYITE